jgi:hypothetical protein
MYPATIQLDTRVRELLEEAEQIKACLDDLEPSERARDDGEPRLALCA